MKKYLLVIDMQNDFIDGSLGTPEAVAIVGNVVEKIKQYIADPDGDVYATRDTHQPDYLQRSTVSKVRKDGHFARRSRH